jgi:DNA-binding transcriptional LysR family regulator
VAEAITDLEELRIFAAVASRGSFVRAAAALAMPTATVSRKVQALETRVGTRLLQRTTRRVSLTEAGALFYERCASVEAAVAEAEEAVTRVGAVPRGTLRVTAPHGLVQALITPVVSEFLARYPEIRLWLTIKNEYEELVGKGVDVALLPWPVSDSGFQVRRLGTVEMALFASPHYLERRGDPRQPEELAEHATLVYSGVTPARHAWTLTAGRQAVTVALAPALVANDLSPLREAARGGAGVAMIGIVTAAADVESGALVRVLPGWVGPPAELRAIYPSRVGLSPKVRVFLDFVAERARRVGLHVAETVH